MRPVCVQCRCEMRPNKNGFHVVTLGIEGRPYHVYQGDKWKCPHCEAEFVCGFGSGPEIERHEDGFAEFLATRKPLEVAERT